MKIKIFIKNLILFIIFGLIYYGLESIWKGAPTHWTIFALGGTIGFLIGDINGKIHWEMPIFQQTTIGLGVAIFSDAVAGVILNILLRLNIWQYTKFEFFWGQCSLPFCLIWLVLSTLCILLDDQIRWRFLGEEKPHYKLR